MQLPYLVSNSCCNCCRDKIPRQLLQLQLHLIDLKRKERNGGKGRCWHEQKHKCINYFTAYYVVTIKIYSKERKTPSSRQKNSRVKEAQNKRKD